jgi:lipopolysaccharide export system permease protein
MVSVIDRYFIREVLQTLSGVTAVLLLIFLSNRLVHYLAEAAAGQLPSNVILTLVLLKSIKYLILLLPLSFYLAILMVQGRMYRDNEMVALQACGVGSSRLYRPVYLIGLPLALLLGWLSLQAVPWTADLEFRIISEAKKNLDVTGISAGSFKESADGKRIIYVESVSEDGKRMKNVFIQAHTQQKQTLLLTAENAYLDVNAKSGARYLVLLDGYRYDGQAGNADYRVTRFAKHGFLIDRQQAGSTVRRKRNSTPTAKLLQSGHPADKAELHWRLSVPVSALVLGLLALPLGKSSPRKGQYGKLFVAILLYIFYVNLLALAQSWTEKGRIPPDIGLWWVHGLLVLFSIGILLKQRRLRWGATKKSRRSAS